MNENLIPKNNDMRIEITTRCNYSCIICPRKELTRRIETMSLNLFKYLFDKIQEGTGQFDTLTFPGMGEPLLDKSLCEKIKYAKSKKNNLSVLILTNGSLLDYNKFKELENIAVSSIRVSLYGNDPHTYSRIHGTNNKFAFGRVRDNLLEICRKKKFTKILLTFNVVDGINDGILNEWIKFWENKVDLIEVWCPHNWVNAKDYRRVQKHMLKSCGRPFRGPLQVQVDGTVNMCCFDYDGKLTIGDLKRQTLKEIFKSPYYKKILKCHRKGNYKGSGLICEKCDQRNLRKDDVAVYNSKFDVEERVKMISTTYKKL